MKVIATKREGLGAMYLICTVVGVACITLGVAMPNLYSALLGILLSITCGYIYAKYFSLPKVVISIDQNGCLFLPKGVVINIKDVIDVSYRRAAAKGIQYRWGDITLTTRIGKYKYGFIAECENVAKSLTEMMHKAKYGSEVV